MFIVPKAGNVTTLKRRCLQEALVRPCIPLEGKSQSDCQIITYHDCHVLHGDREWGEHIILTCYHDRGHHICLHRQHYHGHHLYPSHHDHHDNYLYLDDHDHHGDYLYLDDYDHHGDHQWTRENRCVTAISSTRCQFPRSHSQLNNRSRHFYFETQLSTINILTILLTWLLAS